MAKTYYQLTIDGAVATVHGPLAEAVRRANKLLEGGAHSVTIYKVTVTKVMEKKEAPK